jgi:hypothetical protein
MKIIIALVLLFTASCGKVSSQSAIVATDTECYATDSEPVCDGSGTVATNLTGGEECFATDSEPYCE